MESRPSARELTALSVLTALLLLGAALTWFESLSERDGIAIVPSVSPVSLGATGRVASDNAPYVNVNTAAVEDLMLLPGIGSVRAHAIVEYRRRNGPFSSIDALIHVRGIGTKTVDRLRPFVTVSERSQQ